MISDPTYRMEEINANPVWKLAFFMSEIENTTAPLGWGGYILLAKAILSKYELRERTK